MTTPSGATISKIGGIAVLLCGAIWNAFGEPQDRTRAAELVGIAAALAGIGRKQATAERAIDAIAEKQDVALENQAEIKADTTDIRANPALPGTPPRV